MVSFARIVEKRVGAQPFLEEALSRGLLNYGAVAQEIQSDVEREFGKKVRHAALVMALRRYSEKLGVLDISSLKLKDSADIVINSNLFVLTFIRSAKAFKALDSFYKVVDLKAGDFFTATTGMHELTIIANEKYKDRFLEQLEGREIVECKEGLAAVTVRMPWDTTGAIGLFYHLTRSLAWEGISIIRVASTFSDDTFVLEDKDVGKAYYVLKKEIKKK